MLVTLELRDGGAAQFHAKTGSQKLPILPKLFPLSQPLPGLAESRLSETRSHGTILPLQIEVTSHLKWGETNQRTGGLALHARSIGGP
jgi:hypothetical protein